MLSQNELHMDFVLRFRLEFERSNNPAASQQDTMIVFVFKSSIKNPLYSFVILYSNNYFPSDPIRVIKRSLKRRQWTLYLSQAKVQRPDKIIQTRIRQSCRVR